MSARGQPRRGGRRVAALSLAVSVLVPSVGAADRPSAWAAVGAVQPEDLSTAAWLGAGLRFRVARLPLQWGLGFWHASDQAFGIEATVRDVRLGLDLVETVPAHGKVHLIVAGGGALHFVRHSARAGGEAGAETDLRPAVQAVIGVEGRLAPRAWLLGSVAEEWVFGAARPREKQPRAYVGLRLAL